MTTTPSTTLPRDSAELPGPPAYPLTLRVAGRRVLVVGGGPVAARRVEALIDAGARVVVVSPWLCEDLAEAAAAQQVEWHQREYRTGDLDGAWLVHTATGDRDVDTAVAADAQESRVWCVQAGDAGAATAWTPAVTRVDDVQVAVNAGGDPPRAARLRNAIAAALQSGQLPLRRHRRDLAGAAGTVALVGGGPGDTGLITTRGRQLLAQADVVVVDRLGPRALLRELDDDVLVVDVGKTPGNHPVPQHEINALLVEHALLGRRVVRLKGGDPYVLGRGGEEVQACRAAGVPVEVVPGVTSAVSVPAAAGIPVTHRGVARSFTVLSAHEELDDVPAGAHHTLVLLMGVSRLAQTCRTLVVDGGRTADTPVAIVEDGYGEGQRVTVGTLATIALRAAEVGVRPPAIVVVGDVVRLAPAWQD
jgi:uroporphyrin-III C-methyltransferase / precorrin-2 dehydrogenase / sirohydrochlorin ferrochelatase